MTSVNTIVALSEPAGPAVWAAGVVTLIAIVAVRVVFRRHFRG